MLIRIEKLKRRVQVDTQRMREKTLTSLVQLFDIATKIAKGEVKYESGKLVTLKQRQLWARIAAYIAQIINGICKGFDERQIDTQLDELERLVNEARSKAEAKKAKRADAGAERKKASKGSG
ncbi:MAG: hypothetical protein ACE5KC_03920 [Candidatus Bathyarchaeia archaeon]